VSARDVVSVPAGAAWLSFGEGVDGIADAFGSIGSGWIVEVTPEEGEPFDAIYRGSACGFFDYASGAVIDRLDAVRACHVDDQGEPVGEPFVVIARGLHVY